MYDWTGDVMNDNWSAGNAKVKLKLQPNALVCDALLDQQIFAGVGNIIKNEVCYRIKVHPESNVGALSAILINKLVKEARNYSFDFFTLEKKLCTKETLACAYQKNLQEM